MRLVANVFPSLAVDNVGQVGFLKAELRRKLGVCYSARRVEAAYFTHKIVCQNGTAMGFTQLHSALVNGVCNVLFLGAKKKMLWIDAWGVIARMADLQSAVIHTVVENIGVLVRAIAFSLVPKAAIAIWCPERNPLPAFIRTAFINMIPEQLVNRFVFVAADKTKGSSLDSSLGTDISFSEVGKLPATALAVAVWDFLCGVGDDIITHVKVSYGTLAGQRDGDTSPLLFVKVHYNAV